MAPSLFLHLGMSKTGTTFLQTQVFPELEAIRFFDQPHSDLLSGSSLQGLFARTFKRSPAIWERRGDELFEAFLGARPHGKPPPSVLVSDQSAGPALWETGPYAGPHWKQVRQDPYLLAAHLEALAGQAVDWGFEDLRVLLVFRRQDEWIASKYAQRSDRILPASQAHFEERIAYYTDPDRGFYADGIILDYALLRDLIAQTVGDEKVLMLPYELLRRAPVTFLRCLTDFVVPSANYSGEQLSAWANQEEENVRSTSRTTWALRPRTTRDIPVPDWIPHRFARIVRRSLRRISSFLRGRDQTIQLTPDLQRRILNRYASSNRRLNPHVPGSLQAYGYIPE